LADAKANVNRQIQSLNTLASEYFFVNQGDLILILAQQENARRDP
jgi:hypothetical protein